jgi:hypothetical protein
LPGSPVGPKVASITINFQLHTGRLGKIEAHKFCGLGAPEILATMTVHR